MTQYTYSGSDLGISWARDIREALFSLSNRPVQSCLTKFLHRAHLLRLITASSSTLPDLHPPFALHVSRKRLHQLQSRPIQRQKPQKIPCVNSGDYACMAIIRAPSSPALNSITPRACIFSFPCADPSKQLTTERARSQLHKASLIYISISSPP